jgi:hypothetical protein
MMGLSAKEQWIFRKGRKNTVNRIERGYKEMLAGYWSLTPACREAGVRRN